MATRLTCVFGYFLAFSGNLELAVVGFIHIAEIRHRVFGCENVADHFNALAIIGAAIGVPFDIAVQYHPVRLADRDVYFDIGNRIALIVNRNNIGRSHGSSGHEEQTAVMCGNVRNTWIADDDHSRHPFKLDRCGLIYLNSNVCRGSWACRKHSSNNGKQNRA